MLFGSVLLGLSMSGLCVIRGHLITFLTSLNLFTKHRGPYLNSRDHRSIDFWWNCYKLIDQNTLTFTISRESSQKTPIRNNLSKISQWSLKLYCANQPPMCIYVGCIVSVNWCVYQWTLHTIMHTWPYLKGDIKFAETQNESFLHHSLLWKKWLNEFVMLTEASVHASMVYAEHKQFL